MFIIQKKIKQRKFKKGILYIIQMSQKDFWKTRAEKYDQLRWVKDDVYLNKIIHLCKPLKSDLVLDVGTGSGKVAKAIKPFVKHVIGLDISVDMMSYNEWEGMSKICNDILSPIFKNNTFNLITARMVFHHVSDVISGLNNCYNLLKDKGRIIIAESLPPSDNVEVIRWWSHVRSFKEKRHTFSAIDLKKYMDIAGFKNIKYVYYYQPLEKSSTKEWLSNSKLSKNKQKIIFNLHKNAPDIIKKSHRMKITKTDIFCEHRHIIIKGEKNG
jgi:ubiquinone/menaquinone biosynthesis C-methylase UbiE